MKMYNGEVDLDFSEKGHRYKANGVPIPSVTTIIGVINKPALLFWAAKEASLFWYEHIQDLVEGRVKIENLDINNILYGAKKAHADKRDLAGELGTAIHKWCEDYISGFEPEMPEDPLILNGVNAFLKAIEDEGFEIISAEIPIYSKEYRYGGRLDIKLLKDKKLYLGDIKTGNAIYDEVRLQTAAYVEADQEESGCTYDGRVVVRLGKELIDGEIDLEVVYLPKSEQERDFSAFLAAYKLYEWQKILKEEWKLKKKENENAKLK